MADLTKAIVNPGEARSEASNMVKIATELETLLTNVSNDMDKMNDQSSGIYFGDSGSKAEQLKGELDSIKKEFDRIYGQVLKSADDIKAIADSMENE